ncbi:MAG: LCP family protein [Chloroflexota bacterium]
MLWYVGMGTLIGLCLLVAFIIVPPFISFLNIYDNVQAMYVPPATPTATVVPTQRPRTQIVVPTTVPSPSLEPVVPSVNPTPTHTPIPTPVPVSTPIPQPVAQIIPKQEPVTILLLGSDRRPAEPEPSRTDTIVVAHIDPQQQRVALLSIPRDLWVEVPGYGYTRINAANVLGTTYNAPQGSRNLVQTTVSQLLGIPIDHYVYIDFVGFTGAIDAIGGITVSVQKELYDPQFPAMDYSYMTAHFLSGPQRMDGTQALIYSRIRHTDNDFARMRRQQQVLLAILAELRGQHTFDTLQQTEAMSTALRNYVETNIPPDTLIELAWSMKDMNPESVELYVLDETMITFGVGGDQWAILPRPGMLEMLVDRLQEPQN